MSQSTIQIYGGKESNRRKMLARAQAGKERALRQKMRRVDQRQAVRSKFRLRARAYAGAFVPVCFRYLDGLTQVSNIGS